MIEISDTPLKVHSQLKSKYSLQYYVQHVPICGPIRWPFPGENQLFLIKIRLKTTFHPTRVRESLPYYDVIVMHEHERWMAAIQLTLPDCPFKVTLSIFRPRLEAFYWPIAREKSFIMLNILKTIQNSFRKFSGFILLIILSI